jgi:Zn-dependent peptidase ImmA (M78 family)
MSFKVCQPVDCRSLSRYAIDIRNAFNSDLNCAFPIVDILDKMQEDKTLGNFEYEVVDDNDPLLTSDEFAKYDYQANKMLIKESVYVAACDNDPEARFTLTHELAHFYLLTIRNKVPFFSVNEPKAYCDPEWQADTLASFILVPPRIAHDMEPLDIIKKYNVTEFCAFQTLLKIKQYMLF